MSKLALKLPKEYWSEEQIEKRLIEDCKEAIVEGSKERNYSLKQESTRLVLGYWRMKTILTKSMVTIIMKNWRRR